ncbi:TauD/TfdA family dioxygenase [Cupriavidus sp. AcVe19-1a]|nr:TauD/TfdA family dioxygenase [Cupriavidus sp. AcVe19-1a]
MIEQMIESRKYQRTIHLQVGEALLVDNRRMLHCR